MLRIQTGLLACSMVLALELPPAHAQGGGFAPGELLLYSPAIQGSSSGDGAIVRIDPASGQASILVDLSITQSLNGSFCFDPFRDRAVFCGSLVPGDPKYLYACDGAGQTTELGLMNRMLCALAPTGDGRIYFRDTNSVSAPFRYIDANQVEHTLMDSTGAQPFTLAPASNAVRVMIYDAGTNALFFAQNSNVATCAGGSNTDLSVRKVPLSADGARVAGAVTCAQAIVNPTGGNGPVGWSRAPNGKLLLVVDTNSNNAEPRMQLVDPSTLATSNFAWSGSYAGAAATNAGTYSTALGKAVILDTFSNILRAFSQGQTGGGATITPSIPISSPGGTGEVATLIEVPMGLCATNNVSLYCTAKTTSSGCVPVITTSGGPVMSAASGFVINLAQVQTQKSGLLFYGLAGPAAIPFQGGFLCVKPPTRRTQAQNSGGSAACSGAYSFDFLAWLAGGNDPAVVAGSQVNAQFWFRDPPEPISHTGLSAGVEWTMCP